MTHIPIDSSKRPSKWRLPLGQNEIGLLAALLFVVVVTAALDSQHSYLRNPSGNLLDILRQAGMLGIFALGAAVVIISGGIDLSCGSMIALGGTVFGSILVLFAPEEMRAFKPVGGWALAAAAIGTLAAGFLVGSLHAFLITQIRIPPFIATFGSRVGLRSGARVLIEHVTRRLTHTDRGTTQIEVFDPTFRGFTRWQLKLPSLSGDWLEIPVPISAIVFLVLAVLIGVLMGRTILGRHLVALGGNESAARLSGLRNNRLKWFVYCLSSMLCATAAIFYVGDQGLAQPEQLARGYELNAIAAAVVGGCSLQGGKGTILGTVLGVLFLRTVLDAVAKIFHVGADLYEGMIVGVVVVLAVATQTPGLFRGRRSNGM
jgi:ribose/xylose/arabinose/galactoside ABC-type transport system permease subunit